jgi:hypothetical protein
MVFFFPMSKKAQGVGGTVIFVVLILAVLVAWLVIYSQRECHSNGDCPSDAYCGSDFSCHKYPEITQTIRRTDFTGAAFLIGLAIVAAAIILHRKPRVPSENIEPKVIVKDEGQESHPRSHHPEEHSAAKAALEKFEKSHRKDSQTLEHYGEDAHSHTPKHR